MKKSNCTVHGKPMYRIRAKIGEDLNGKPVFRSFYGDGKAEAERKRDSYLEKRKVSKDTDKTFGQLAEYYTYNILTNEDLTDTTIELYERQYRNKLAPSQLMIRKADEIEPQDLQKFLNSLRIAPSAMTALFKYMKHLFKWLYREGYCRDVMYGVVKPKTPQKLKNDDISVFNEEEVQCIISKENRLHFLFLLALSTGLREGELLALRYSDFKEGSVSVKRQYVEYYDIDSSGYKEWTSRITQPKTASSVRTVPLPENVWREYEAHKAWHEKEMLENGYTTDYVFTSNSGNLIDKSNFRRAWIRHLKSIDVTYRKFHSCRATYCTLLCKNGVSLETASKLMGHSDISTTAQFYRMVSSQELISAAAKINNLFKQ